MLKKKLSKFLQRRLLNTFKHSVQGLLAACRVDESIRGELILLPVLLAIAILTGPGKVEKVLLISSTLLVLVVELLNTGLEKAIDRISTEHHQLSKMVKDIGSAAVLVSILNFLLVWLVIFL